MKKIKREREERRRLRDRKLLAMEYTALHEVALAATTIIPYSRTSLKSTKSYEIIVVVPTSNCARKLFYRGITYDVCYAKYHKTGDFRRFS